MGYKKAKKAKAQAKTLKLSDADINRLAKAIRAKPAAKKAKKPLKEQITGLKDWVVFVKEEPDIPQAWFMSWTDDKGVAKKKKITKEQVAKMKKQKDPEITPVKML